MEQDSIEIRATERSQLLEVLPRVIELYRSSDSEEMDDRADRLETVFRQFKDFDGPRQTYDLGAEQWELIVDALDAIDSNRIAWLRSKLARRANLHPIKMGFTTRAPIGWRLTEQRPTVPESHKS